MRNKFKGLGVIKSGCFIKCVKFKDDDNNFSFFWQASNCKSDRDAISLLIYHHISYLHCYNKVICLPLKKKKKVICLPYLVGHDWIRGYKSSKKVK